MKKTVMFCALAAMAAFSLTGCKKIVLLANVIEEVINIIEASEYEVEEPEELILDSMPAYEEEEPAYVYEEDEVIDFADGYGDSWGGEEEDYVYEEEAEVAEIAAPAEVEIVEEEDETIYAIAEEMPEFPGGGQALFKYLADNVKYPVLAQEAGIQGRVICQFVVEKDGSLSDVEVVRTGGDASLDKEAIRVINAMPKWKPGKQGGKTVRVRYSVPVNFRLQ